MDIIMEPKIIFENEDYYVCYKPAGLLSQASRGFEQDLVSWLLNIRRKLGQERYVAIINRLDRPVEGLVLAAKTKEAAARLSEETRKHALNKCYYAIVNGKLAKPSDMLVDYMKKDARNNSSGICDEKAADAKLAKLTYEVVKYDELRNISLVRIKLETGRHHQIRVQFASRKHALLGDTKYGVGDTIPCKNVALCAYSLDICGKHYEIEPENELFASFEN